jgi:uncharacterized membrane protein
MSFMHLHLLLNHFPIIGSIIALGLFLIGFVGKNEGLRRASLILFVALALLMLPTCFSGIGARAAIKDEPGISAALMERHEGAAMLALFVMEITGALALVGLWRIERAPGQRRWSGSIVAILIFSILTVGLMARVGNTGGDIRHPEIRVGEGVNETGLSAFVHIFEPSPDKFTELMLISKWWWAFIMDLHFIGLALLIGTVGLLNLRVLGFLKRLPAAPLHGLMPWAMAGFGINVLTGLLAYIGMPGYYTFNIAFWLKILAILLVGLNLAVFYLTDVFPTVEHLGAGEDAPAFAKFLAGTTLFLWFAVITLGRYIQSYNGTIPVR